MGRMSAADTACLLLCCVNAGKSGIHAWGVFAAEEFKPNEVVVEYIGQIIRDVVADKREALYAKQGVGSDYMFRLERDTILDATRAGSLARYINHSCDVSQLSIAHVVVAAAIANDVV